VTVLLMAATALPAIAADDVLKVCLDEDLPPLSSHHQGAADRGFDVALAEAVAGRLVDRSRSNGSKASSTRIRVRRSKPMPCSRTTAALSSAAMP